MEATVTGSVHVDDTIDPVDSGTSREVWPLEEIHVLQCINLGWIVETNLTILLDDLLHVELDCRGDLVEVVRRYLGGHPDRDTVAAVQQQVGQASR